LVGKREVLVEELRRVSARRRNLDRQLAWAAPRWVIDQAVAHGATVVYLEDLRTLEAGPKAHPGPGRARAARRNATVSNTVRAQIVDAARHLGGQTGIAVVTVPAAGTSRDCPRCLTALVHTAAADTDRPGRGWSRCPACGYQAGRDHAAAERIVGRGLATQTSVRTACDGTRTVPAGAPDQNPHVRRSRLRRHKPAPLTNARPDRERTTAPPARLARSAEARATRPGPAAPPRPRGAQRPAGRRPSPIRQAPSNTTRTPRATRANAKATARGFPRRARATLTPRRHPTCTASHRL
jgi:hypothetical protein